MDIVYSSDHKYMFYCCVSISSLMTYTPSDCMVKLHLLIDGTFTDEDERLIGFLRDKYVNLTIITHRMEEELFSERDFENSLWSKASFYRLLLPELLPDVKVCLYLDSDTLILDNIMPLWDYDLTDCYIAGVFEDISAVRPHTVGNEIPGIDTYINSGVLLMNLELMRNDHLQERFLQKEMDHTAPDQDLLNILCYGKIKLLPPEYNYILGIHSESVKIQHFLMQDYIRPWKNLHAFGAQQWWKFASGFSSVYDTEGLRQRADWYQKGSIGSLFRHCADYKKVYIVGSGDDAGRLYHAFRLGKCRGLKGIVKEEESIPYENDSLIILASRKRNIPAIREYCEHPDGMDQIIHYEHWPVAFFNNSVSRTLNKDLTAELLMWEFGVDARGMETPGALLELNAVRYPEREAIVEYDKTGRHTVSFEELNRRSNRIADRLRNKGIKRGTLVKIGAGTHSMAEYLTAALGIMKSGCILCLTDEADVSVDMDAPEDRGLSPKAPKSEVFPDEPVLFNGHNTFSGRSLTKMAQKLRRRYGFNREDRLLLIPDDHGNDIIKLLASFVFGTTIYTSEGVDTKLFLEILQRERITIGSMSDEVFKCIADGLKSVPTNELKIPLDCRMIITDSEKSPEYAACLKRWHDNLPYIPVNGMGYKGEFCYDSEWY